MKKIICLLLSLVFLFAAFPTANAEEVFGDFEYGFYDDGTVYVSAYRGKSKDVVIPDTLGGYSVSGIGEMAFMENTDIESVVFPESLEIIDMAAFGGCTSLKQVHIPSNVYYIGLMAFALCTSLTEISVAHDNEVLTSVDGVLYTKDIDALIYYPSGKSGEYDLPAHIKAIEYFALAGAEKLTAINVPQESVYFASVDGVLFNKQKDVLIAFPAGRSGEYTVPDGVIGLESS